jgi:hypothetical protein
MRKNRLRDNNSKFLQKYKWLNKAIRSSSGYSALSKRKTRKMTALLEI